MATYLEVQDAFVGLALSCSDLVRDISNPHMDHVAVSEELEHCFERALFMCFVMQISLVQFILFKMEINKIKYDEDLDFDDSVKQQDGTMPKRSVPPHPSALQPAVSAFSYHHLRMDFHNNKVSLSRGILEFAKQRNWLKKYSNHLLRISLLAEIGEIAHLLEWKNPGNIISPTEISSIAGKVANICIYLFHISRLNKRCLKRGAPH